MKNRMSKLDPEVREVVEYIISVLRVLSLNTALQDKQQHTQRWITIQLSLLNELVQIFFIKERVN